MNCEISKALSLEYFVQATVYMVYVLYLTILSEWMAYNINKPQCGMDTADETFRG